MNNAERIRNMDDEQLARFLWTWKINSITLFLTQGGRGSLNAKEIREWIVSDDWICRENKVGEGFVFDQDFNLRSGDE